MTVRVRFAPSPTGSLHIGSVRTTLYNYFVARQKKGTLVLRIEDTDQDRLVEGAIDSIYDGLGWLGIGWDEGPREGGAHAPYVQSERLPRYQKAAQELVDKGAAYFCFCSKERLAAMRAQQQARGEITKYDGHCRNIDPKEAAERAKTESHVVRLKVPDDGTIGVDDLVYGHVEWPLKAIEDQIILKSDGFPTYHLAVVVDDHTMGITHIFRGEDWLPSTPKHLLVYQAFGWPVPPIAHFPNVLGADGKKLSKRHGATKVEQFRADGYLPEAMINYLALIGWAPGTEDEVFTMAELVERFRIDQVQRAGGKFDRDRLDWFNGVWIRRLSEDDLVGRLDAFIPSEWDRAVLRKALPLMRERMRTLAEGRDLVAFLFTDQLPIDAAMLLPKKKDAGAAAHALAKSAAALRDVTPFTKPGIDAALRKVADDLGWHIRELSHVVRVATMGGPVGLPLFESLELLGRDRALARIARAQEVLRTPREAVEARRFVGQFAIEGGKPITLRDERPATELFPDEVERRIKRVADTLKAYRESAKELLSGEYAALREFAPAHMRTECDCYAILCEDGIVVRWEKKSNEKPRIRIGLLLEDANLISTAAPKFSEGYVYLSSNHSKFQLPDGGGIQITLSTTDAQGRQSLVASNRLALVAVVDEEARRRAVADRPIPLVSVMNEMVFQMHGEEFDVTAPLEPGQGQEFIVVNRVRMNLGWEAFEVYPEFDQQVWDPAKANMWARLDLLAGVTQRNVADRAFEGIDPRASTRRSYALLFEEFRALLDGPEEPVQQFLQRHPEILSPTHSRVWPKLAFGATKTDFVFREGAGEYLLVEIEAPVRSIFTKEGQPRAELTHAVNQVADWIRYIQDNLSTVQRELQLTGISPNPHALVVIGRSATLTEPHRRKLATLMSMHPSLRIITYDELLESARRAVEHVLGTLPDPKTTGTVYYVTRQAGG